MSSAAFSTLGLPGATIEAIVQAAVTHGFGGVELRVGPDEAIRTGMSADQRRHARHCLETAGVTPISVASYVKVADPGVDDAHVLGEAAAHLRLTHDLGAEYLRVFPGAGEGAAGAADDRAARRLAAVADVARPLGVTVALETHDSHGAAARTHAVLDRQGCSEIAAIWDVLHTWLAGERPSRSCDLLGDRLAYVQIKDVPGGTDLTPVPPGDGVLPLDEMARALAKTSYQGWISWEYERAWHPERPPLEEDATRVRQFIDAWT